MADDVVWAVALRRPLPKWGFPNGSVCAVREVDVPLKKMIVDAQAAPTEAKYRAIFELIVPDATEEDWLSQSEEDMMNLMLHAGSKIEAVQPIIEAHRKNGLSGIVALANTIPHSTLTTPSSTPLPESHAPSGETGASNSESPIMKRSSRSTRSRKSSALTDSSTTSTP